MRFARGRFGGSIQQSLLQLEIDVPLPLALDLDTDAIARVTGNKVARVIRGRLRRGLDGDGKAAHEPKDGTKPFQLSGRLLKHVRYDKDSGVVAPNWRRTRGDAHSARVRTSYAVMSVHIAEGRWGDPMGSESPEQLKLMRAEVETEIQKQLDRGALRSKKTARRWAR